MEKFVIAPICALFYCFFFYQLCNPHLYPLAPEPIGQVFMGLMALIFLFIVYLCLLPKSPLPQSS